MARNPYKKERVYHEGWAARQEGQPLFANPYRGTQGVQWELGWYRADAGGDYDGYAFEQQQLPARNSKRVGPLHSSQI